MIVTPFPLGDWTSSSFIEINEPPASTMSDLAAAEALIAATVTL